MSEYGNDNTTKSSGSIYVTILSFACLAGFILVLVSFFMYTKSSIIKGQIDINSSKLTKCNEQLNIIQSESDTCTNVKGSVEICGTVNPLTASLSPNTSVNYYNKNLFDVLKSSTNISGSNDTINDTTVDKYDGKIFTLKHGSDNNYLKKTLYNVPAWVADSSSYNNSELNKQFKFTKDTDKVGYIITSNDTQVCLDGDGTKVYTGSNCSPDNDYQSWIPISGDLLQHKKTGKCLDGNGMNVYFGTCTKGNKYQEWQINPA